jgi:hypothetical protein
MKTAYQLWKEDQAKRQKQATQDAAQGKVNFKEASKASRVQYSLPGYQGDSKEKSYNWETDQLKSYKANRKGVRSYNDKFDNMTKRMGMSPGQADDYRRSLDFSEDSKQEYKLNKDGSPNQAQNIRAGQGAHLQSDIIDGIFKNMYANQAQSISNNQRKQVQKAKDTLELTKKTSKERDGLLGVLDKTLGRAGDATHRALFGNDFVNTENENYQKLAVDKLNKNTKDKNALKALQMLNTTARAPKTKTEKAADFIGTAAGELAPYTVGGAYGAADAVLGKVGLNSIKSPIVKDLIRGIGAGTIAGTEKAVSRGVASGEKLTPKEYAKRIGLEAALAGGGDAALGSVLRNLNLKGQLNTLLKDTGTKSFNEQEFKQALEKAFAPKGNVSNVVADTIAPKGNPQQVLDQLLSETPNISGPQAKTPSMNDFISKDIPNVDIPNVLNEVAAPKTAYLSDLIKGDITPESIAKAYNEKQWYHGTGTNNLTKENLDPLAGNHEGLFGNGVYMTDNPDIANGYAKSRGKKTSAPTIYDAKVNMNRVLDLEKPIPDDAKQAVDKFTSSLDYQYNHEFGEEGHFSKIANEMASKGATTEEIIQKLRSEVTDFSHEAGISTNEFVENFQDLAINLKSQGYDGITHTGGGRTGNNPHRVLIALDPNDLYAQTGRTNQIHDFNPNDPVALLNQIREGKWNNIKGNPNTSSLDEMLNFLKDNKAKKESPKGNITLPNGTTIKAPNLDTTVKPNPVAKLQELLSNTKGPKEAAATTEPKKMLLSMKDVFGNLEAPKKETVITTPKPAAETVNKPVVLKSFNPSKDINTMSRDELQKVYEQLNEQKKTYSKGKKTRQSVQAIQEDIDQVKKLLLKMDLQLFGEAATIPPELLPDTRSHIGTKTVKQPGNIKAAVDKGYIKTVDNLHRLNQFDRQVEQVLGKKLDAAESTHTLGLNSRGSDMISKQILTENMVDKTGEVVGKSLKEITMKVPKGKLKDFEDYLINRHAITRMERGEKVFPE